MNDLRELVENIIKENTPYVTVDGVTKSVIHQPSFSYTYNDKDEKEYNHLVNIDVEKFDNLFKKSDYYIGHKGSGQIKNRYENFGNWFKDSDDNLHAPYVSFNQNNEPEFTNGRHRYAWLRDNNVNTIPMTMSTKDKEIAEKLNLIKGK